MSTSIYSEHFLRQRCRYLTVNGQEMQGYSGRRDPARTPVNGSLNVRGYGVNESMREVLGSMFVERMMDILALIGTKIRGNGKLTFGSVVGRVSRVERGRGLE
ncbi:hypothetical protein SK128_009508 [Halocaridina rubra]|uniref:Uncharacterized protein n=1 Tax=Halocaridina rubra TaxID=373956 RepID=A0AAN8WZN5_HALRR